MNENSPDDTTQRSLAELRAAMSGIEAPADVKAAVLREYTSIRDRRKRHVPVAAWIAIAACLLLTAVGLYRQITRREQSARPQQAVVKTEDVRTVPEDTPKMPPARPRAVKRRVRRPRRIAPAPVEMAQASVDFYALPSAPPIDPAEGGAIVRVTLPRSAIRRFGIAVDETDSPDRITADVMLGSDGVARAVRFVSLQSK